MIDKKLSFLYSAFERTVGSLSIRYSLPLMIVTPLVLGVAASTWFSFQAGKQEIENLVEKVSEKSTKLIELNVRSYLETSQIFMRSQLAAIESEDLKFDNFSSLQRSFWHQLQQQTIFNNIYYGNESGDFLSVQNQNQQLILKIRDRSTDGKRNLYQLDSQGNRAKFLQNTAYDPRLRPWYQAAKESEKLAWSSIFQDSSNNALTIALFMPILEQKTGKFQGALAIDLSLQAMSDFLRNLSISPSGQAFIIERSGYLVGISSQEQPFKILEGKQERLKMTQSQDPAIQATAQYLSNKFNNLDAIESKQQFSFTFGSNSYFVEVTPLQDKQGLNWLLVVVIPKSDFTKYIYAYTRFTIILGLIVTGVTVIFGLLMVRWIDQPIQDLYKTAKAIESEKFDPSSLEAVASRRDEFGGLGKVFLAMAQVISSREHNLKRMLNQLQNQNSKVHSSKELEGAQNQLYYWEELLKEAKKIRTTFESLPESQIVQDRPKTLEVSSQQEIREE